MTFSHPRTRQFHPVAAVWNTGTSQKPFLNTGVRPCGGHNIYVEWFFHVWMDDSGALGAWLSRVYSYTSSARLPCFTQADIDFETMNHPRPHYSRMNITNQWNGVHETLGLRGRKERPKMVAMFHKAREYIMRSC